MTAELPVLMLLTVPTAVMEEMRSDMELLFLHHVKDKDFEEIIHRNFFPNLAVFQVLLQRYIGRAGSRF